MSSKALSIANALAGMFGSGSRQGGPAKQSSPRTPSGKVAARDAEDAADGGKDEAAEGEMPMAKKMAQNADPVKRAAAASSMKKAFKD
jgi:hypothetical protein